MDESSSTQGNWVGRPRRAESAFHPKVAIARRGENLQLFVRFRADFESFFGALFLRCIFRELRVANLYQFCTVFREEAGRMTSFHTKF